MSTEITRGPNVCPSCGEANPPTAAYCHLCAMALGAAIQKTPSPVPVPFHFPPSDPEQVPQPPMNGFMEFVALVGLMFFLPAAIFITFVAVCSVTTALLFNYRGGACIGIVLGGIAVAALISVTAVVLRWMRLR
jgi:hypothetical protein